MGVDGRQRQARSWGARRAGLGLGYGDVWVGWESVGEGTLWFLPLGGMRYQCARPTRRPEIVPSCYR